MPERVYAFTLTVALMTAIPAADIRLSPAPSSQPFHEWRTTLIEEALKRGFKRDVVQRALGGLQPLPRVLEGDRAQAGPGTSLDAYLSQQLTQDRVMKGRERMREHRALLDRIERRFGVQRRFVVAIWGLESAYGSYAFEVPVFQALATLAWEPRRAAYFRGELFDALRIAQGGQIDIGAMRGSWAGAMGQPQFMPSSYLQYAYDFDRDGRRDIWRSTADTLASIANYLRSAGWQNGQTWGREVSLTDAVHLRAISVSTARTPACAALRTLSRPRWLREWDGDGVRLANGSRVPRSPVAASLLLTGDRRRFLVDQNYESILAYNCSHRYALSVGLLADLIR